VLGPSEHPAEAVSRPSSQPELRDRACRAFDRNLPRQLWAIFADRISALVGRAEQQRPVALTVDVTPAALLEPMIERAHFQIESAVYSEDGARRPRGQ
jgi:hypothetical protein